MLPGAPLPGDAAAQRVSSCGGSTNRGWTQAEAGPEATYIARLLATGSNYARMMLRASRILEVPARTGSWVASSSGVSLPAGIDSA